MDHCLPGKKVFAGRPRGAGREKQPLREMAIAATGGRKNFRQAAFIDSVRTKCSTRLSKMKAHKSPPARAGGMTRAMPIDIGPLGLS
jgi:hypothetical protein